MLVIFGWIYTQSFHVNLIYQNGMVEQQRGLFHNFLLLNLCDRNFVLLIILVGFFH